jgi:gliding motility-associated-like protein
VTNSNGCKATATVTVSINDPLSPNAYLDTTVCPGEQVQLFAQNGQSYQWIPSTDLDDPSSSSPIASPGQNTVYYVSMMDVNGCLSTDSVRVSLFSSPTADAGTDLEIYEGQSVTLSGSGGTSYLWRPGDGMNDSTSSSPSLTLRNTTVFTLFVTDQNGCIASDQVTVSVLPVPNVYLPSAFTPNGDGQNDQFVIPYGNDLDITRFVVYDRWGAPVFFTQDPLEGWDGTSGGEVQPVGTYVYILEGFYSDGTALFKQGNVTLIR